MSERRAYRWLAVNGFLLGLVGLVNLGYVLVGGPLSTGTVVLIVGGLAGLAVGIVAARRARRSGTTR